MDHPGHERYFKTSVFGLTSHKPHYVMLTVSLDEFDRKIIPNKRDKNEKEQEWANLLSLNLNGLLDGNTSSDDDTADSSDDDSDIADFAPKAAKRKNKILNFKTPSPTPSNQEVKFKFDTKTLMAEKSNDPSGDYHKYLTMCESINVPLFIVITKSDIDKDYDYKRLPKMLNKISTVIASKSHNKLKIKLIETSSEASRAARALSSSVISYIPIIVTSCVNGEGLEILKTFLFSLPTHFGYKANRNDSYNSIYDNVETVEFGIDDVYDVHNVGTVTSGIVRHGTVRINDKLSIGPDKNGNFQDVTIGSIHVRRKDCSYAFEGQMASLHLKEIQSKSELRRGMVIVDGNKCNTAKQTCYSFEAHIDVLLNCTLREDSQPIIHIENIRQSAHILHLHSMDSTLKHGEKGTAVFTFLHYPEFIRCGMKIIIRKSHGPIAIGRVTKILDSADKPLLPLNSLQKPHRLRLSKSKTGFKNYLEKWNLEKQNKKKKGEQKQNLNSRNHSEKEIFFTSDDDEVEVGENPNMESINIENDNEILTTPIKHELKSQHNEYPIRIRDKPTTDTNTNTNTNIHKIKHKNRNNRQRKRSKQSKSKSKRKNKSFTLVWRSGLGFENFYPKI